MNNKLSNRIKIFRKRLDITQKELEAKIGGKGGMISRIEKGSVNPDKETILKISKILNLHQRELDYLIGFSSDFITKKDEIEAVVSVKTHFKNKNIKAFLLDDRWRFIDISQGFLDLFNWNYKDFQNFKYYTIVQTIVDTNTPFIHILARNEYYNLICSHLPYYYAQVYFMVDDESFIKTEESINKNPFAKKIWIGLKNSKPVNFIPNQNRKIIFQRKNKNLEYEEIPMLFSREPLFNFPRFEVMEYLDI